MNIAEKLMLIWRRFSPLEERLLTAVREVLPPSAQTIFDAQVAGITHARRFDNEIYFYRKLAGKVDWRGVPAFSRIDEFELAEVRFIVDGRLYKAKLISIGGHIFEFVVTPNPTTIAFADWDSATTARLLSDPITSESAYDSQPIPDAWQEFLERDQTLNTGYWRFHNTATVYSVTLADADFLVLAESEGNQFVLHRIEPPASTFFYVDSHDGIPEPIKGDLLAVFANDPMVGSPNC